MTDEEAVAEAGEWTPIRVGRVSAGAAILAAILLLCTYITHPFPRWLARPLGLHEGDFADRGGIRLDWDAPTVDEPELDKIAITLQRRNPDGDVWRSGRHFHVILAGVAADQRDAIAKRLTQSEGLTFRECLITQQMADLRDIERQATFEKDEWRAEDTGESFFDIYVTAPTREEIEKVFADARAKGWQLPAGSHIAYEHLAASDYSHRSAGYRSYVVRDEPDLDGSSVASAEHTYDPNTNRPIVMLDFDRDGGRKFADLTTRIAGHKLAVMIDGEIRSAPVINGPIRGGRASINMGAGSPEEQDREADELVETLRLGTLPAGGTLVDTSFVPPTASPTRLWLARALLALLAGLAAFALAFAVLRFARPVKRPLAAIAPGSWPWSRLAVMAVAPLALWGVSKVTLYGINTIELSYRIERVGKPDMLSIGALGIMPVLTAYVVVEVFALLLPTWRRRRNAGPEARKPITLAAAVVTVLLVAFQAWNVAKYLGQIEGVLYPGPLGKVLVVTSLAGGTLILIIAAEVIRWRGLGNGYGALLVTGWLMALYHHLHSAVRPIDAVPRGDRIVEHVAIAVIAAVFAVALRWRVRRAGEHALRFPTASFAPLADAGGILALIVLVSQLPLDQVLLKAVDLVQRVHTSGLMTLGLVALLAFWWSLPLGRPRAFAGAARPSWPTWTRAAALSVVVLGLVAAVALLVKTVTVSEDNPLATTTFTIVDPVMIAITVAVVLDAIEDFRARRQKLVVAWTLHDPHHADAVKTLLAADGIVAHTSASHLRALLSFFGPFVPIEVQVPAEHAEATREKLERLAAEA